jgi:hypothetical protein
MQVSVSVKLVRNGTTKPVSGFLDRDSIPGPLGSPAQVTFTDLLVSCHMYASVWFCQDSQESSMTNARACIHTISLMHVHAFMRYD